MPNQAVEQEEIRTEVPIDADRIAAFVTDLCVATATVEAALTPQDRAVIVKELAMEAPLPSLLDQLQSPETHNVHRHDDEITSRSAHKAVLAKQEAGDELNAEEAQLLEDVATLYTFNRSGMFLWSYTPVELHELASRLSALSQKNRPDFNGVEERIVDHIQVRRSLSRSNRGVVNRAEEDRPGRTGMTFDMLAYQAGVATRRILKGRSAVLDDYYFDVADPSSGKGPDLSAVYRFVVADFALETIGTRKSAHSKDNAQIFEDNVAIIDQYLAEQGPILQAFEDSGLRSAYSRMRYDKRPQQVSPVMLTQRYAENMHRRLENGATGLGLDKGYLLDTGGAINLQLRIGHAVEELRTKWAERYFEQQYAHLIVEDEGEAITPLDIEDL